MAYNKLASDARAEMLENCFRNIELRQAVILAIGESSFASAGKHRASSQAGLII